MTELSTQRWLRVKEVFAEVAAANGGARRSLLEQLCRDDPALKAEVDSLLLAHESATRDGWLKGPLQPQQPPDFQGNARFRVESRLGEGGFGVVYQVLDQELGRRLALKLLRRADPAALVLFKREFRVLADRAHPNLVRFHDLYVEAGQAFFTMELVRGSPLTQVLAAPPDGEDQEGGGPRASRIIDLFGQLAEGVSALHAERLLHRDLKPENVLVTPEGRVVILDFGLATDADLLGDQMDAQRRACGTPAYMAPEQFGAAGRSSGGDAQASEASDWYSVGVMLYEVLAGHLPYQGDLGALRHAKRAGHVPALPPSGTPALDRLCLELLCPTPAGRPGGSEVRMVLGAPGAGSAPPLFVGRQAQLSALGEALASGPDAGLRVVCVSGRSGMGKSALCRRFLQTGRGGGAGGGTITGAPLVLTGRCHEREALGFKALDGIVDDLSRALCRRPEQQLRELLPPNIGELARLFPALLQVAAIAAATPATAEEVDIVEQRRRAFEAFRELLRRLADRHQLILFIDDLQWGDSDSAALLRHLLRPPAPPALLLVVAFRQEDAVAPVLGQLLEALQASTRVREVVVNPLAPEEARACAEGLLGAGHPSVAAVVEEAGGIPFFVSALVDRVRDGHGPSGAQGAGQAVSIDAVLGERVARLPDHARRFLQVVALAGKPVHRNIVRAAAGLPASEDDGAEHLLRARRLIRPTADDRSLETYHDRFSAAVAAALPPAELPQIHRLLAEAMMAARDVHPEDVAHHLFAAGDRLEAARFAVLAAQQWTITLAFDRAAALYKAALGALGVEHESAPALLLSLADALANAGRAEEAGDAYLAAASSTPARRLELLCKGGAQLLRAGDMTRGPTIMTDVLQALGVRAPASTSGVIAAVLLRRARLFFRGLSSESDGAPPVTEGAEQVTPAALRMDAAWALATSTSTIYTARAFYLQTRHLDWALDAKDPFRLGRALALEAVHASLGGTRTTARAERILRLAREVGATARLPVLDGILAVAEAAAAFNAGRWQSSYERSSEALQLLNKHSGGVAWELAMAGTFVLGSLAVLGELRQYEARSIELSQQAASRGDVYAAAMLVLATQPQGHYLAGDRPDEALLAIEAARLRFEDGRFKMPDVWALVAKIDIALYQGDAATAWRLVSSVGRGTRGTALLARDWLVSQVQIVRIIFHHLRGRASLALAAAVEKHERRRALLEVATTQARAIEREGASWARGLAYLLRASVAELSGAGEGVSPLLRSAWEALSAAELGIHVAVAGRLWAMRDGAPEATAAGVQAEAWMSAQGIVRPERFVGALAPGLSGSRPS